MTPTSGAKPPDRPASWDDLTWRPQPPVRWFNLKVLAGSGARVLLSSLFGSWFDKRELQAALGDAIYEQHAGRAGGMWIDYVADTGDGFDASYTIAELVGQSSLEVAVDAEGEGKKLTLPRGDLLVLGGDEVYPVASAEEYEQRLKEPYRASLPWTDEPNPELWAIPGNHDWYDGLTSFLRIFGQREWIGGRKTLQDRSYFALQLPHGWWLWGVDMQFDAYVDAPQFRYFQEAASKMAEGDRVILCVATPSWIDLPVDPDAFRNIAFLDRRLIRPKEATLALTLSGDLHHYSRYRAGDSHLITAGGGGAFLHPTHNLPSALEVPVDADAATSIKHDFVVSYPSASESRRLLFGFATVPFSNRSFAGLLGLLNVVFLWANQLALRLLDRPDETVQEAAPEWGFFDLFLAVFRDPFALSVAVGLMAALIGFAKPPRAIRNGRIRAMARLVMGTLHGIAQLAAVAGTSLVAMAVVEPLVKGAWFSVFVTAVAFLVGAVVSGVVFGAYLALCNLPRWGTHGNEAFSAIRRTRYKGFLRLHIKPDGGLDVWAIGVDKVCKDWTFDPEGAAEDPWLVPSGDPPIARLIERIELPPPASQ